MNKTASYSLLALAVASSAIGQCIGGKWDTADIRPRDCTTQDEFDGLFGAGANKSKVVNGTIPIKVGSEAHILSWRLSYWKSPLAGVPKRDSLPLILGLHAWQDTEDLNVILNSESYIMEYEGGWEDVLFLTVALENSNDLGTWWWGTKVNGVPTPWAEEAIIALLKDRIKDACSLLAKSGATDLATKSVDTNRVYLRGHSMGGTGTYRMGIKHPEIFAAIHAHAGFADFKGNPCGNENFCLSFSETMVGTEQEHLMTKGLDGKSYPARDYTDMSWFVGIHKGASAVAAGKRFDPPYVNMTHGKLDDAVNMAAANRLQTAFKAGHYGYSYFRYTGGHSESNFVRFGWLSGFRKNQSYLAFDNNSTDVTGTWDQYNDLSNLGWRPATIQDKPSHYEVDLFGNGTVDITPRRLQAFIVQPGKEYRYWLGAKTGAGAVVKASEDGLLTLTKIKVSGTVKLTIEPVDPINAIHPPIKALGGINLTERGLDMELEVVPKTDSFKGPARMELWGNDGRLIASSDSMIAGRSGELRWRLAKPHPGIYRLSILTPEGRYMSTVSIGL